MVSIAILRRSLKGKSPTCNDDLGFKVSLLEPLDSLGELSTVHSARCSHGEHRDRVCRFMLRVTDLSQSTLIRHVPCVDEHIACGELDAGVVGV